MDPAIKTIRDRVGEHLKEILEASGANQIPPKILFGLVAQESAGNPQAVRHEPAWRWFNLELAKPGGMSKATESWGQAASWGLCQLMGTVAREHGFKGWWPELCEPALNLHYGAKHLAGCIKRRNGDMEKGLLRYNGGGDTRYPAKVMKWAGLFETIFKGEDHA